MNVELSQTRKKNAYSKIKLKFMNNENLYFAIFHRANISILIVIIDDIIFIKINNVISMNIFINIIIAINDVVNFV